MPFWLTFSLVKMLKYRLEGEEDRILFFFCRVSGDKRFDVTNKTNGRNLHLVKMYFFFITTKINNVRFLKFVKKSTVLLCSLNLPLWGLLFLGQSSSEEDEESL